MMECDYLIVGGGAAGAVLANRLSGNPAVRVILLEAGRDVPPAKVPADIADIFPLSTFNSSYAWPDLKVHWRRREDSPPAGFQQGRILGGGSSIMGMWAVRGMPQDYDSWARDGAIGWAWRDVLPYFRMLEADKDFTGDLHGTEGPLPIRRQSAREWSPLAQAMRRIAHAHGYRDIADMNGDFGDGYCVLPISRFENRRASAGLCYLDAPVRSRANLEVITLTRVSGLTVADRRVTGAIAARSSGPALEIRAQRTILTAGAIYSPAVLMRSGIGPGEHLRSAGIEVILDRAGVGKNLQNHPLLPAVAWLTRSGRDARRGRPPASTYLRWSSGVDGMPPGDMGTYIRSYLVWHALGRQMAMVGPVLMKPASRGDVKLELKQPHKQVSVAFNFFDDPRDLERMMSGFRATAALLADPGIRSVCGEPFVLVNAAELNRYNELSRSNAVQAWIAATLLDLSPRLGNRLISRFADMRPLSSFVGDNSLLAEFIQHNIIGTNHVAGTCRMGSLNDPAAVVDPAGNVIGLDGLIIADASIMPSVPSGNTHLATIMIAEKIAAGLCR